MIDSQVINVLKRFQSEDLVFIPNPGNAGDSFIACATYQMFDDLNISYRVGSPTGLYPGSVLIYGGGGNLIGDYSNAISFIMNNHNSSKALILLPHTIDSFSDTLANLGANCYLFCREVRSYEYVLACVTQAQVFLSHDLALGADLDRIRSKGRGSRAADYRILGSNRSEFRLALLVLRHMLRTRFRFSTLSAFRTDIEKTDVEIPTHNFDVSAVFATRDLSPDASARTTRTMIRFLDRYKAVRTNRLHVCIMSLMLGKRVQFYSNSYYKNEAIYKHSLKERFPLLEWMGNSAA
jgi:exopolysaccharide biosynthesis predicted pyruvyltransferase EpsI